MKNSKALSTDASEPVEAEPSPESPPDLTGKIPSRIARLGGFADTVAAIEAERKERKLPVLLSKDYRFVLGMPGGIPFSFPVTVIYKPESPQEQVLGTYRIGR